MYKAKIRACTRMPVNFYYQGGLRREFFKTGPSVDGRIPGYIRDGQARVAGWLFFETGKVGFEPSK